MKTETTLVAQMDDLSWETDRSSVTLLVASINHDVLLHCVLGFALGGNGISLSLKEVSDCDAGRLLLCSSTSWVLRGSVLPSMLLKYLHKAVIWRSELSCHQYVDRM